MAVISAAILCWAGVWRNVDKYEQLSTIRHMPSTSADARLVRLARRRGSITRRQVAAVGIHTQALSRLVRDGQLERVGRGVYRLTEAPVTEHHGLALVAAAVPNAVICLLSALSFHRVGTQLPHEVWIALDRRTRRPTIPFPRVRVLRFGGAALTEGVQTHRIEGVTVRVYNLAKTIADTFKYRNKIGLDVALEALRDAFQSQLVTFAEIEPYARICRMQRVMRPYCELLAS